MVENGMAGLGDQERQAAVYSAAEIGSGPLARLALEAPLPLARRLRLGREHAPAAPRLGNEAGYAEMLDFLGASQKPRRRPREGRSPHPLGLANDRVLLLARQRRYGGARLPPSGVHQIPKHRA